MSFWHILLDISKNRWYFEQDEASKRPLANAGGLFDMRSSGNFFYETWFRKADASRWKFSDSLAYTVIKLWKEGKIWKRFMNLCTRNYSESGFL